MKIACLSGKGGAGKTMAAVNLAAAAGRGVYIDCDVEEPNGRLFLKPEGVRESTVSSMLPEFDAKKCNGCKKCVEFCRFHALMYIKEKPIVFSEVCHSCGGCMLVCPEGAVSKKLKPVGKLEIGARGNIQIVTGILNPGEASGVPVIREALAQGDRIVRGAGAPCKGKPFYEETMEPEAGLDHGENLTVIDCPPGSACSVMESVMDADFCILLSETTSIGFHNFRMVHQLVTLLGKKCGVVLNKQEEPYELLENFCEEQRLPVLARIPYDSRIGAWIARGELIAKQDQEFHTLFVGILKQIGGSL